MKNILYIFAFFALPFAAGAQVFDSVNVVSPEFFPLIDVNDDQGFRIPFRRTAQNRAVLFSDIVGYIDTTITGNIQTLLLSNDTLYISDGNNVILEPYSNEVLDLYTSNDTLFLSTEDGLFFTVLPPGSLVTDLYFANDSLYLVTTDSTFVAAVPVLSGPGITEIFAVGGELFYVIGGDTISVGTIGGSGADSIAVVQDSIIQLFAGGVLLSQDTISLGVASGGNGIYGGSGIIPALTVAEITDVFQLGGTDFQFLINNNTGIAGFISTLGGVSTRIYIRDNTVGLISGGAAGNVGEVWTRSGAIPGGGTWANPPGRAKPY